MAKVSRAVCTRREKIVAYRKVISHLIVRMDEGWECVDCGCVVRSQSRLRPVQGGDVVCIPCANERGM